MNKWIAICVGDISIEEVRNIINSINRRPDVLFAVDIKESVMGLPGRTSYKGSARAIENLITYPLIDNDTVITIHGNFETLFKHYKIEFQNTDMLLKCSENDVTMGVMHEVELEDINNTRVALWSNLLREVL